MSKNGQGSDRDCRALCNLCRGISQPRLDWLEGLERIDHGRLDGSREFKS